METIEEKRQRLLGLAKEALKQAYASGEHGLIQAVNAYNELEKSRNLIHERLEEWYGIYFPELRLNSQKAYAKLVAEIGASKKNADYTKLAAMGIDVEQVKAQASSSIGRDPDEEEYNAIKELALAELALTQTQERLDAYIKQSAEKLMPNITSIIDYKLAAELLSKAGSLEKLANMPASTIQLLGAEKALFRHMKFGSKPPKYGILFRLGAVANARKEDRGRVARLYAAKISIAARADAYSKSNISEMLKHSIESTMEKIMASPKPQRQEKERQHGEYQQQHRQNNQQRQNNMQQNQNRNTQNWQGKGEQYAKQRSQGAEQQNTQSENDAWQKRQGQKHNRGRKRHFVRQEQAKFGKNKR